MATVARPLAVPNLPQQNAGFQLPTAPKNEELRLETLKTLGIAGSSFPPDPMLNSLCKTISKLLEVPIAGVSVVQDKQLYMRAATGIPSDFSCGRDGAFCSWTLMPKQPEIVVIEDTLRDPRFATLDHVKGPDGLRFYAGAPLVASNGTRLGAVCVFDSKPRKMKAEEYNMLSNFSEIAIRRLEEREFKSLKTEDGRKLQRSQSELSEPIVLCDVSANRWWNLLYCNTPFTEITGVALDSAEHSESNFWKLFRSADPKVKARVQDEVEEEIRNGKDFTVSVMRRDSSNKHAFEMHFKPATTANLSGHASSISVPNIVAAAEIGDSSSHYYFATVKEVERLTAQRFSESKEEATQPKQRTFMSEAQTRKLYASGSHHGDRGMRDVTMGVLCSNSPDGLVYRARWRKRSVSVRVIEARISDCLHSPEFGDTPVPYEAALSLKLDHPNIITTYKVIVEESPDNEASEKMQLVWMVREWCGRGSLYDAMARGWLREDDGKVNLAVMFTVAHEVASAVTYLHEQGVIHGDISPESVLLVSDNEAVPGKRKDFAAKIADLSYCIPTGTDFAEMGAQSHAAPELLSKGEKSKATDVYALGMLLWEIYTGQAVWPSLSLSQLQRRVLAAKEKPPMPQDIPLGFKDLIDSCLENAPADRPSSLEVAGQLRRLIQEEAAGKLVYTLAGPGAPGGKKGLKKLFSMDGKKRSMDLNRSSGVVPPSKELRKTSLTRQPSSKEEGKPKGSRSLFRRFIPGLD